MKLADRMRDNEILSYIAKIHEYKGRQELYVRQKPVALERLVEIVGYRNVPNTIHESHNYIPVRPTYILQLHTGRGTFYVQKDAVEIN